jgi:hypothetical protein
MQLRMHHQEEEMRRSQQENTLFMQVGLMFFYLQVFRLQILRTLLKSSFVILKDESTFVSIIYI